MHDLDINTSIDNCVRAYIKNVSRSFLVVKLFDVVITFSKDSFILYNYIHFKSYDISTSD